jgi:GT2 family glycosyltransferase
MAGLHDITALIVNYRTLEVTRRAVESFREHYPRLRLLLIDNGSGDESSAYLLGLRESEGSVEVVANERNRYHGPAMDQGIRLARTRFVFTLDSDCEVFAGGFLERMLAAFEDDATYAVGELRYKNRFGYTYGYDARAQPEKRGRIPYIHPYAMLIDREKYLGLRPFIHHGAPCIRNMASAKHAGYTVVSFPIYDFVLHHAEGTSADHGYGMRARARQHIEHVLSDVEAFVRRDPVLKVQKRRRAGNRSR